MQFDKRNLVGRMEMEKGEIVSVLGTVLTTVVTWRETSGGISSAL